MLEVQGDKECLLAIARNILSSYLSLKGDNGKGSTHSDIVGADESEETKALYDVSRLEHWLQLESIWLADGRNWVQMISSLLLGVGHIMVT